MVERRRDDAVSLTDPLQRRAEPPRPSVSVKRHAVMRLEPAAHAIRMHAERTQILIRPATSRVGVDRFDEPTEPFRRLARSLERVTSLTGTVACEHRIARRPKKLYILRPGLARRAARTTEDACRAYARVEDAIVARIPRVEGIHEGSGFW